MLICYKGNRKNDDDEEEEEEEISDRSAEITA
jgi:hypothetical protein